MVLGGYLGIGAVLAAAFLLASEEDDSKEFLIFGTALCVTAWPLVLIALLFEDKK